MNKDDINFSGILWPLPYREKALKRADILEKENKHLGELYKEIFNPELLRLEPISLPIPFSKKIKIKKHLELLAEEDSRLPLSIVTITRNDTHVERMAERTQAYIDSIYYLAEKYQRRVEMIIVEWNPPSAKPTLHQAFNFPTYHNFVSTVIVQVPTEVHDSYQRKNNLPLYQMIGKNVGIRRARGKFVLATNIDVLLSEELFELITSPAMQPGKIYRSNRWDVDRNILDKTTAKAMLESARELCFQINYAHATVLKNASIGLTEPTADYAGFRLLPDLHTMACGDFQLLHRDDWSKLTGYSELDTFSLHLDSLFAINCHYAEVEEVRLDNRYPHYHIDHTLGTSTKGDTYVIENKKEMKHLSIAGLLNIAINMKAQQDHYVFNKDNWGLAGHALPTIQLTKATWEQSSYSHNRLSTDTSKGSRENVQLSTINVDKQIKKQQQKKLEGIIKNIADYLKKIPDKNIYIWGAGHKARAFHSQLQTLGIKIQSLIHNGTKPPADINSELTIIHSSQFNKKDKDFLVICSMYADEIIQQMEKHNFIEGQDYMVAF